MRVHYKAIDDRFRGRGRIVYSQFGEDGLIEAALEIVGESNRWCFEVGASDGRFLSNTLHLREQGWQAVLAESTENQFKKLDGEFGRSSHCVHQKVVDLDALLKSFDAPRDIDVGVIDVDGQDYWLWHDMTEYRPKVLVIEYSPYIGSKVTPTAQHIAARGQHGQTAATPIVRLANERGYKHVAKTFCNLILIDDTLSS
jgi:hypothetical protein